jgi:protein ImuA
MIKKGFTMGRTDSGSVLTLLRPELILEQIVNNMTDSPSSLADLRGLVAEMEGRVQERGKRVVTGHQGIDAAGIVRGRLHELFGDGGSGAASGFTALMAFLAAEGAPVVWLRTDAAARRAPLYGPGLMGLGIDPAACIVAQAPDETALIAAAADALRVAALGAVIAESVGRTRVFGLTGTRRLTLAAEASGVPLFLLRLDAEAAPSAAETRWHIAAAPSRPLEADAPGHPAFDVELLRRRAGPAGMRWRVEWDRDARVFHEAPLSGAVVPVAPGGEAGAGWAHRVA